MVTIATCSVQNYATSARTDTVTLVIPLADGVLHSTNTTFELRAVGAKASPVRVQWHSFGRNYPSGYRKRLRIIFECDMLAGSSTVPAVNAVTIEDTAVAPTAFVLHSAIIARIQAGMAFAVNSTGSMHLVTPDGNTNQSPNPQGIWTIPLDFITNTVVIDEWKDPDNAIVKRFRAVNRGAWNVNDHGTIWVAQLILEVTSNSPIVRYWLKVGNSLVTADTPQNTEYANDNPLVSFYNTTTHGPGTYGVFVTCIGPEISVEHEPVKVANRTMTGPPTLRSTTLQIFDPDNVSRGNMENWADGSHMSITGAMVFRNGSPSASETASMDAAMQERLWGIATDWKTKEQTWGVLGALPDRPSNSLVYDAATALSQCIRMEQQHYTDATGHGFDPIQFERYGNSCYISNDAPGDTASQGSFSWIPKLWPWALANCARLRVANYWVQQEWLRPMWYVDRGGDSWTPEGHRSNDPNRYTDVFIWTGRPFVGNSGSIQKYPTDADLLGKRGRLGYRTHWSEVFGFPKEHDQHNTLFGYVLLTGDWMAIEQCRDLRHIEMASFQHSSLGGLRNITVDGVGVPRALGRGVQSITVLADILDDQTLIDRAKLVASDYLNSFYKTAQVPNPVCKSYTYETNTDECRNYVSASVGGGPSYYTWQDSLAMPGWVHLYKVLPPSDPVYNQVITEMITMMPTQALYAWRMPGQGVNTGQWLTCYGGSPIREDIYPNRWYMPKAIRWEWDSNPLGTPVPSNEFRANVIDINSAADIWCMTALVVGWEIASLLHDTLWAARCRQILNDLLPVGPVGEEGRAGAYGFGDYPVNNVQEFAYVWPNAIKTRDLGISELQVSIQGTGTLAPSLARSPLALSVTIEGTSSHPGLALSNTTGGATRQLEFGTVIDPDGTVIVKTGLGDLAPNLVILPPNEKEFSVTFTGNLGDILPVLRLFTALQLTVTISGVGDIDFTRLGVIRPTLERYQVSGSVQPTHPINIVIGDQMINENESFRLFAGNTASFNVSVSDQNGSAYGLENVTAIQWILSQNNTVVTTKSLSSGISVTSIPGGTFDIMLLNTDTVGRSGPHKHECHITLTDGSRYTLFTGELTLQATMIT